ncbi:uncharacterized protein LOC143585574 [Bidens hawaiensis]|uniref:uncharacterized protein LOC143585574 n=1 Tax=Bidens hawaiensis TaxID=980011 RepID=UPI00404B2002
MDVRMHNGDDYKDDKVGPMIGLSDAMTMGCRRFQVPFVEFIHKAADRFVMELEEDLMDPIIELDSDSDEEEMWMVPDLDGQEFTMDTRDVDGHLCSVNDSSGKSYDIVSSTAQEPKIRVILNSSGHSKIRRKIERRVSFVHYMEPSEVPKDDIKKLKQLYERSSGTSLTNSSFATPSKSIRPGHSSGRASTHSSGRKSSLSEEKVRPEPSRSSPNSGHSSGHSEEKRAKKKHMSTHSSGRKSSSSEEKARPKPSKSSQNSGHSSGHSEEKKAKKKRMA